MDEIMQFIQVHWMEWFLTAFSFALTVLYRGCLLYTSYASDDSNWVEISVVAG